GNTVVSGSDSSLNVSFTQSGGTGSVTGLPAVVAASGGIAVVQVTGDLAGSIEISASATNSASEPISSVAPLTFNVTQSPAATLAKVISGGDPYAAVGDVVSYGYTLTNTGNVTLSAVSVSDDNTDAAPSCDASTLAPTEFTSCTAIHTV